jgi:hypothetical protein
MFSSVCVFCVRACEKEHVKMSFVAIVIKEMSLESTRSCCSSNNICTDTTVLRVEEVWDCLRKITHNRGTSVRPVKADN